MAFLQVVKGLDESAIPINESKVVLGRVAGCGIVLDVTGVSREHAEITRDEGNAYFIEDKESRNGTFVNQLPIKERTPLREGDAIRIGKFVAIFMESSAPTAAEKAISSLTSSAFLAVPPWMVTYARPLAIAAVVLIALFVLINLFVMPETRRAEVTGQVTLAGVPVPQGTISFFASKKRIGAAPINNGYFTVIDAPVGDVVVLIEGVPNFNKSGHTLAAPQGLTQLPAAGTGSKSKSTNPSATDAALPKSVSEAAHSLVVPEKFKSATTSDKRVRIAPGKQTLNIELGS